MKSTLILLILIVLFSACHSRLRLVKVRDKCELNDHIELTEKRNCPEVFDQLKEKEQIPLFEDHIEFNVSECFSISTSPATLKESDVVHGIPTKSENAICLKSSHQGLNSTRKKVFHNSSFDIQEVSFWTCAISFYVGWAALVAALLLALFGVISWWWMLSPLGFWLVSLISLVLYVSQTGPN